MKSVFNLLLILILSTSCSKDEEEDYKPYLKGNIVGYAMLFDQFAHELEDHGGIRVYTEPGRAYSAITDAEGRFEIKGVPTGTYNLSYEKEGFNTMIYAEVHHLGGKPTIISPYIRVVIYPDITVKISNIIFQNNQIKISLDYAGTAYNEEIIRAKLYFSTSDGFNISDAEFTTDLSIFETGGYFQNLPEMPFTKGINIYCKGCLYTSFLNAIDFGNFHYATCIDNYFDDALNTTVFPNITEESDQYAFILQ